MSQHTPPYRTCLYPLHEQSGAKFGPFAGYDMPLSYPLGVMKEHLHTRQKAGLFDISHMLHIEITGSDAARLIARLCPYEAEAQKPGAGKYTFMLNEKAGIKDDLIITRLDETRYLIIANAGCAQKDLDHIKTAAGAFDASVTPIPRGFIALQGPGAEAALEKAGIAVAGLPFMHALETEAGWFISRSGYTGEDGFEIGLPEAEALGFAEKLLTDENVALIGLGARDSLRLEAGLPLYGQDLEEDISPLEAGLIWAIPKQLREGGDFIGAKTLTEAIKAGPERKRVGLKPKDKIPVRGGVTLVGDNDTPAGMVTSGGFGPSLDWPMAMALVKAEMIDQALFADVRGRKIAMEKVKLPFHPHNYKR